MGCARAVGFALGFSFVHFGPWLLLLCVLGARWSLT